jgi:pimeloyl-ACP methyl ester carboxylesterase
MGVPILKGYYGDVFFEAKTHSEPRDTIVILSGFPSSSSQSKKIDYLYEKGFNVFAPIYPGTYQSNGIFLENNIVHEMNDFIGNLSSGKYVSLWDNSEISFSNKRVILLGGSFSGTICCGLAAMNESISKVILGAPVWDYSKLNINGDEQDPNTFMPFIKRAYRHIIRFNFENLVEKMNSFEENTPEFYLPRIKIPLLVFHDPDDSTVSIKHTYEMSKKIDGLKLIEHTHGHNEIIQVLDENWNEVKRYLE